jgi:uncharacterized protein YbaP (TraB family)
MRWLVLLLTGLALTSCGEKPLPANPALWRINGPHGQRGWLFGTIHMLPRPLDWRTPKVDAALAGSDRLVVEIAALDDDAATARVFDHLAHRPGQPPLSARVGPAERPALAALLRQAGMNDTQFANVQTWAAALMLAQAAESHGDSPAQAKWGIDRALLRETAGKPVAELEGAQRQLSLFAGLPERDQRALLVAVVTGAASTPAETRKLAEEWRSGNISSLARETHEGMLAEPQLRDVLYVQRNRDWAGAIASELAAGQHPFVAVGAAHMAGGDGLPALLTARGFTVTRIE